MSVVVAVPCWLQDAAQRPGFPTIKQRLTEFAAETFQCSAEEAVRAKHLKERALLDQILPPKVDNCCPSCYHHVPWPGHG